MLYNQIDKPKIGDIIMNQNPYDGESPWFLIGRDNDYDFRAAQGPGKYNPDGWDYDYCQIMTADQITQSYRKIGFISLN